MSSYCLMFPEFRSSLMFSGLDLSLLLLVFSFIFTVASRLLHLYSTDDKTSVFENNGLLFWLPVVLCQPSEVVLWSLLSVEMFFWGICEGESGRPVLFLHHLRTAPPNWCFWTVVLKTLESPLDWKEVKPVNPKGNQPWIFIGRTDVEAETPILWPPDVKTWLIRKDPDAGPLD